MKKRSASILLIVSIILTLLCCVVMNGIDTSWGNVDVKLGKLVSQNGTTVNYKIYIPKTATAENPAPGLLWGVGGGDGVDAGRAFCIEASRRGMVAMTIDVPGNGLSESTTGVVRFDSNNQAVTSTDDPTHCHEMAFQYLSELPFVDSANMVTGGHSMGGMYTIQVAQNHQDQVKLQTNVGMNMYGDPELGYDFNFALLIGTSDESALVRTTNFSTIDDIYQAPPLKAVFGMAETDTIEEGKVYGDFAEGTGRVVMSPHTLHIWEPYTNGIVKDFVMLVEQSISVPNPIDSNNTVYLIRDFMIVVMICVVALFMIAVACLLLETETFSSLAVKDRGYVGYSGKGSWWIAAIAFVLLIGYSVIWCYMQTGSGEPNYFTRFGNSGAKCIWSIVTGVSLLLYMIVFHFVKGRKDKTRLVDLGLATGDDDSFHIGYIGKTLLYSLLVFGISFGYFLLFYFVTKSNLQLIVFEIDPIIRERATTKFLAMMFWMLPFVLMNAIAQKTLVRFDTDTPGSTAKALTISNLLCCLAPIVLHVFFVANAYFGHRTIFTTSRGYIGGEQVMAIAIGTLIINSLGFYIGKKTKTIWPTVVTTLLVIAWFQVTASGMTF
ncbi:MAG: hypothetical protein K6A05_05545 [Lachnospiraceae bacterium]|nr:hypothetical protein [Lachnospiraceae bacterium]